MTCKNDSNEVFDDGLCSECYVRDAWVGEPVKLIDSTTQDRGFGLLLGLVQGWWPGTEDCNVVWQSAAEFTRARKREVAEIEEEITVVNEVIEEMQCYSTECAKERCMTYSRILSRERELLESKRKGMR